MNIGKFIVFEGGEGSGKSSHVKLTLEYLQQKSIAVVKTHEPGGTEVGQHIRQLLLENSGNHRVSERAELFLFLADRAQHVAEFIQPNLAKGNSVLCDRFTGSTLAYQIGARHLEPEQLITQMEQYARLSLTPDIVFYLDVDPKIGIQRKQQQIGDQMTRFDNETLQFHNAVRNYFIHLAQDQPHWMKTKKSLRPNWTSIASTSSRWFLLTILETIPRCAN
jgi:dTMP kinase